MCRKIIIFCVAILSTVYGDDYYKLDSYDAKYKKLDEPPLTPQVDKSLHPSSIYKYRYPQRKKRKPSYNRIEIIKNKQALNRLEHKQQDKLQNNYFLSGVNLGIDLYNTDSKYDILFELGLKLGYMRMFSSNSIRAYIQTSGKIGIKNVNDSANISASIDALFDITIANLYVGGGYGGEYYFYNKHIIHGPHLNIGINRAINKNSNFDVGINIPFYGEVNEKRIKNNVNFVIAYNYLI